MKGVTVNAPQRRTTKKAALSNFCLCPVLFEPLFIRTLKENNWGGGDSNRKAALLEEELMGMFKTKKEIYKDEVEDFLGDFLDDNFSTYAEDESPAQVAAMLVEMFAQCGRFDYTLANAIREEDRRLQAKAAAAPGMGAAKSSAVASSVAVKGDHEEDDSSSDDEDDDMGGGGGGRWCGGWWGRGG
eukprot:jgi/Undpi1/12546/HiC_scaffold_6.g02215.m1